LRDNCDKLDSIVVELLVHETLDEAEVYAAAGIPREAVAQP
jgi:cell division protease FtsH